MNYKLLTPGPLTTSNTVKEAMLVDHCTWDLEYKEITQTIRQKLLDLAHASVEKYTTILMQGSGSFGVESVLSSVLAPDEKILICANGAYGLRMASICQRHNISYQLYQTAENESPKGAEVQKILAKDQTISALAMVHSETTSGILNPLAEIAEICHRQNILFIVDAMSSFGGIEIEVEKLGIDFLVSSANKCIQGVPGFSFVIAAREPLENRNFPRSLALDLYDQYQVMEKDGKWRFTSPTHTVLAFLQALKELEEEGGVTLRHQRYSINNALLREKMAELGFKTYVQENQGPFITSFLYPTSSFDFANFYQHLKVHGFVIYPGKISSLDCFRIGNIGEIYPADIEKLIAAVASYQEVSYVY